MIFDQCENVLYFVFNNNDDKTIYFRNENRENEKKNVNQNECFLQKMRSRHIVIYIELRQKKIFFKIINVKK